MDKITESCFIWEIGFATRVFGNLTRFVPKKAAIWIYWLFSLRSILAKYLDVCETTATTTHVLRAHLHSADKYCFKSRAVCGRIASPGCLLCSLSRAGERTRRCHHYRAERNPTWETWLAVVPWMWIHFHCQHQPCWALRDFTVFMWEGAIYMGGAFRTHLPVLATTCLKCFISRQFMA